MTCGRTLGPPRRRAALELAAIATGAGLFVGLVPDRPVAVDVALALLALALLATTARFTRPRHRHYPPLLGSKSSKSRFMDRVPARRPDGNREPPAPGLLGYRYAASYNSAGGVRE